MYVWEMIACRLRGEGWSVWHATRQDDDGCTYTVHFHRPALSGQACGETLTEAYAEAARRAHDLCSPARMLASTAAAGPHFAILAAVH
ncbi:MAG TPA: hypothetical protein VGZ22_01715 [Isosphaeraceae bacterium]|jgi:hypothetical protein|nr:hypothetical protein [Isosphaeraceae bacterium]